MSYNLGKYQILLAGMFLAALVLTLYLPVISYDFIALDDNLYVVENANLQKGISLDGLAWATTTFHTTNWHPLTWLSYLADYELFGLNPAGYHLGNMILHLFNTLLLFILLRRMTGEVWKGVSVAALFAVHPLNIESVVWIAERKNLLSTLFWILTLLAYVRYVEKPGWKRYSTILVCFIFGLTAKSMLVTLPFTLLLLDYWPLQRLSWSDRDWSGAIQDRSERRKLLIRRLIEKIPLIIMSLVSAFVTFHAARTGGAVKAISVFPMVDRIENAIVSYAMYLYKMVWPTDLAIFYPYPAGRPLWQVGLSILFLTTVTILVWIKGRSHRYLITGWFWYMITLLPVIGLVQVGFQSMANRYTYISLIGIFVIVIWGVEDLLKRSFGRDSLPAFMVTVLFVLAFCTMSALPDWKNSEAAFQQALKVTKNNHIAELGMGNVWFGRGDLSKAQGNYRVSLRIKPDFEEAYNNLGLVYARQGKPREAETAFRQALILNPDYAAARINLARFLRDRGRVGEAIDHFRAVVEVDPGNAENKREIAEALRRMDTDGKVQRKDR
jgi:protein O-mannosyl-transferase